MTNNFGQSPESGRPKHECGVCGIFGHEDCHYYADMKGEWQGVREAERTHHVGDLNEAGAILKQHWPWVQRLHLRYATVTPDKRKLAAVEKIL